MDKLNGSKFFARFVGWMLNRILIEVVLRCCCCCLYCFLLLGQQVSACTFDHLFVWSPSVSLGFCLLCGRLSKHLCPSFTCYCLFRRNPSLTLKFRKVLKHTENRSCFTCNQNIKEHIPIALAVFLCFETKRPKQILYENIQATRGLYQRKNWVQCLRIT